ncbi:DUF5597 domain-containing protein [Actinomyces faecalis]|uniref:DUF5597 domain-containing protein n=1 Tax=Actinomyces faecalis TaxID=2722820 RepID=UPI001557B9E6|nr:DUF5597 domain-containing protein [Actinomyces faecalis]
MRQSRGAQGIQHVQVAGVPRLLLGGQLHNSTSSDLERARDVFDTVVALGGNAVTATVSWHLVEPEEGCFVFDGVTALVEMAAERGLALTLLWFGAFKNAASTYAPRWVRADCTRFVRAEPVGARGDSAFARPGTPVLSVFSPRLRAADRAAFEALAAHLSSCGAAADDGGPLVMVQVENETGLLGGSRDGSVPARAAWQAPVPSDLVDYLAAHEGNEDHSGALLDAWVDRGRRRSGSWTEVFGEGEYTDEAFMAWGFASYCEELAAAAARVLPVTYYANAWLGPQPGQEHPGQYPSGGPASGVIDVWKAAAPSLALVAPDVYTDDVRSAVAPYRRLDNPLLLPESRLAVGNLVWAVGCGAIGVNVFGVDDVRHDGQVADLYHLLAGAERIIVTAQREGRIRPVLLEPGQSQVVELGGLRWSARGSADVLRAMFLDAGVQVRTEAEGLRDETTEGALVPSPPDMRAMGLLVELGPDEVLVIGQGLVLEPSGLEGELVEIDDAVEGCYRDGVWQPGRNLNGDERLNLLPLDRLAMVRITVLRRGDMPGEAPSP